jgi:hypothetical protein
MNLSSVWQSRCLKRYAVGLPCLVWPRFHIDVSNKSGAVGMDRIGNR